MFSRGCPEGGINLGCEHRDGSQAVSLPEGTVRSVVVEEFNGRDWEKAMKEHKTIKNMSKE